MPVDLSALARPDHTAMLTMEVQRGVVGDLAVLPELAAAVQAAGTVATIARLCTAARRHGARVVHCTAAFRPDRAGSRANSPLQVAAERLTQGGLDLGSPGTEVVPELGLDPRDLEVVRLHGLTPFAGTSLDQILRNLGVATVVVTGTSLNVGVLGLALNAVDLGYSVVVPSDAVVGIPAAYGDAVLTHTMSALGTVCTTAELLAAWDAGGR